MLFQWMRSGLSVSLTTGLLVTQLAAAATPPRVFPADAPLRERTLFEQVSQASVKLKPVLESGQFYLSVSDLADSPETAKEFCETLTAALTHGNSGPISAECVKASQRKEIERAGQSGKFRYHVSLTENADGSLSLKIANWKKSHAEDFGQVSMRVEPAPREDQLDVTHRRIGKFFEYLRAKPYFEEAQVATCSRESKSFKVDDQGRYIRIATGQEITVEKARELCARESTRLKHFLLASTEIAASLGVGAAWYWTATEVNAKDWDSPNFRASLRAKFVTGRSIRFDNNDYYLNAPGHPLAGTAYYMIARSSNYNALEAFLFSLAGSTLWELIVEFREVMSINDMIFTPIAGSVIGEVGYQLGRFFDTGAPTVYNKILGAIFGGPERLNRWILKNAPDRHVNTDKYGFRKDIWHHFDLFAGGELTGSSNSDGSAAAGVIGINTQIFNIPGHGQAGKVKQWVGDSAFTQLLLQGSFGNKNASDFQVLTQWAFAGYYRKDIQQAPDGKLKGYSFFIGPSTAFEFRERQTGEFSDRVGVVNVIGSTMELVYYSNGLKVRAMFDVYGDFAAIRSYAIDEYEKERGAEGIQSVLSEQRYYFAFGMTAAPKLEASYGPFSLGASLKYQYYDSIEGLDRKQYEVTHDVNAIDTRTGYKAWVSYALPGTPARIAVILERIQGSGRVEDVRFSDSQTRVSSQLIVKF